MQSHVESGHRRSCVASTRRTRLSSSCIQSRVAMMLPRSTLLPLLGMVAWCAQRSNASVVSSAFEQYLKIETEIERSAARGPDDRASDEAVTALRQLGSSWYQVRGQTGGGTNNRGFEHMKYFLWMAGGYNNPPTTTQQVMETAKEWMCVCLVDTVLVSTMGSNAERWLAADSDHLEDSENHQALARDIKDAIARFHDETQIEIALELGRRNEVALAKYMAFVERCLEEA